jgi:alpha-D-ribose 1-methylphosphonate 5-triphosphate synthase subunit PhnH
MKTKHHFNMVMDAQGVFRSFLDALANPGRPASIASYVKRFAEEGRWLAPAVTLLDQEAGFFWNGASEISREISFLTGSAPASLSDADFVFLPEPAVPAEILEQVKGGSHVAPHDSALLLIATDGGNPAPVALRGPGIPPEGRVVMLSQTERAWLDARESRNFEYPCGVEMVFLREDASIVAIARKAASLGLFGG